MAKMAKIGITNEGMASKVDTLSTTVGGLVATVDTLSTTVGGLVATVDTLSTTVAQLVETVEELAESTQRGFTGMQEANELEHEKTRKLIAEKADLYEVVKHPEFDRLEQRVTQLELR